MRLAVDDTSFLHIMGNVGNMHTYFPLTVLHAPDRERVVEVLCIVGVDGKGGDVAEVLPSGNLLGGNVVRNLISGIFHGLGIDIG